MPILLMFAILAPETKIGKIEIKVKPAIRKLHPIQVLTIAMSLEYVSSNTPQGL
jgi:hypothetical protein